MAKGFHDSRYRELIGMLTAERQRLGLSQRQLAERLGHHQQFVSRFETGERRLDVVEFCDVAAALDMSANEMVALVPAPDV
nr:helix-turn-helix transcriptional regulator [uncultured Novosphingobium sp.]